MSRRTKIGTVLIGAVLLCVAFASLLEAEEAVGSLTITSHDPTMHEVGVALDANVQATFDDDVNAGTVSNDTLVVHGHLGGLASGTFSYHAGTRTVTLDPARAFHAGEVLRVSAASGILATGGAGLTPYGWQFTAGEVYPRCLGGFADTGAALTGVDQGSAAWGDYDNDGDLDILLTGWTGSTEVSTLYRNDAAGSGFTDIGAGLLPVSSGSVAWGDVDRDGDLDILLTGSASSLPFTPASRVYRNDGGGAFSVIAAAGLSQVSHSSVAWGDYDNDGDLDFLLTGLDDSWNLVSEVYRNDGASVFADISAALTGVYAGSAAWGDADNDGDLDILLTGCSGPDCVATASKVYRNDGASGFADSGAALTGVGYSSVAWGDYDIDGDLDILLTGYDGTVFVSKVYRNNGSFSFTDIGAGLTPVNLSSAAWGDHDNDGDLDILLTGSTGTAYVSKVYSNDGASGFTDIAAGLISVAFSSVAWGDADNDGDLDILLTGRNSSIAVSKVYRNVDCLHIIDHEPEMHETGVPLAAAVQATFDADVNVSTVTNDTFVVHGHLGGLASGTFGYDAGSRTVTLDTYRSFHAGEVLRVSATGGISNMDAVPLPPYGWQFTAGPVVDRSIAAFVDTGAGLTGVYDSSVAWADYDNDGDLDILLTGYDGDDPVSKVYRNDGASGFADIGAGLAGIWQGSAAWGDYDNDGDLDIVLAGVTCNGICQTVSKLYRNDGGGTFADTGASLSPLGDSSVAWGDYDNDGDLDILLTGSTFSKVYRNDGGGTFSDIGAGLTGVENSSVAWGDYDNDGDLDILLTGYTGVFDPLSRVYRNDGGGAFADIGASLTDVYDGSVAWGDYDNDGDLDILLTGRDSTGDGVSKVYRNDGASAFTDIGAGLTDVLLGSVAWGDADNDGDLDILLTGGRVGGSGQAKVYRNDGSDAFSDMGAGLTGVFYSSAAWGDIDNDGDLDILLAGSTAGGFVSKVYRNNSRPELRSVTPSSGSGPVGATTYFTTTWREPDGWENLKQCYFHIGDSPSLAGNVTLLYNAVKNKLWLLDDSGTSWLGGCHPGWLDTVDNSQATLDCGQTLVRWGGDTLGVRWAVEFKPGFEGAKKLGLKCKDRDKAKAKAKWKGTWMVE